MGSVIRRISPAKFRVAVTSVLIYAIAGQLVVGAMFGSVAQAAMVTTHVVINEMSLSPTTGNQWIELYNPTSTEVVLTDWRIEGVDPTEISLSGKIDAKGFKTFDVTGFVVTGGTATLYNDATVVDIVTPDRLLPANKSYARIYDANEAFELRTGVAVTKNASNGKAPQLSNFSIDNYNSGVVRDSVLVSANATDDDGTVAGVDFYVIAAATDGSCTEGVSELLQTVTSEVDSKYRATLDVSELNGGYCVFAVGHDNDGNASPAIYQNITIDNTAPVLTIDPRDSSTDSTPTITGTTTDKDSPVVVNSVAADINPTINLDGTTYDWAITLSQQAPGTYTATATSTDGVGNTGTMSQSYTIEPLIIISDPDPQLAQSLIILSQPFPTPGPVIAGSSPTDQADTVPSGGDVLAANIENSKVRGLASDVLAPSIEGWKFFGFAWYWWTIVAAISGGGLYVLRRSVLLLNSP